MGLFDNLAGLLGGGAGAPGEEEGGGLGMIRSILGQGGGEPSSGVIGSLLGAGGDGQPSTDPTSGAGGGLAGMLETLAANGLGQHVASWRSDNPNLPISEQQIHDALGSQQVQEMAQSSGLPIGAFLQQLAQHLPAAASEAAGAQQS